MVLSCGGSWRTEKPQLGWLHQAKAEPDLWGSPVRTLVKGRDTVLDFTRSKVAQALMETTAGVGWGWRWGTGGQQDLKNEGKQSKDSVRQSPSQVGLASREGPVRLKPEALFDVVLAVCIVCWLRGALRPKRLSPVFHPIEGSLSLPRWAEKELWFTLLSQANCSTSLSWFPSPR